MSRIRGLIFLVATGLVAVGLASLIRWEAAAIAVGTSLLIDLWVGNK